MPVKTKGLRVLKKDGENLARRTRNIQKDSRRVSEASTRGEKRKKISVLDHLNAARQQKPGAGD